MTVVTGFLGSGKTTFVNHLLHSPDHGLRLAIVENEFGEVGVDDALVMQTSEQIIEMMNGCICCTVRDDLIVALKKLVAERGDSFDAIIIETTGLADPAPVAQTFFIDDEMQALFTLDAIVTFVDCKHTPGHLDEVKPEGVENEAVEQVAFADVLVLNKTDLVTPDELAALKTRLRGLNGVASMVEASYSRVPIAQVLNIGAFNLDRTVAFDAEFLNTEQEHVHDRSVTSVGVCLEGEFFPDKFNAWLSDLLRTKGTDIFRSKGVIAFVGSDERFVFQGVHMLLVMGGSGSASENDDGAAGAANAADAGTIKLANWAPGEKRLNKICFIGRNLDRAALVSGLEACIFDGKYPDPGVPPKKVLRFAVGTKVRVNAGKWVLGTIVAHWYREPLWETGCFVPYQIRVDSGDGAGNLLFAPKDSDAFVRAT